MSMYVIHYMHVGGTYVARETGQICYRVNCFNTHAALKQPIEVMIHNNVYNVQGGMKRYQIITVVQFIL